jgi:hypothetical protein
MQCIISCILFCIWMHGQAPASMKRLVRALSSLRKASRETRLPHPTGACAGIFKQPKP